MTGTIVYQEKVRNEYITAHLIKERAKPWDKTF